jgi:hypothetical protein
MMIILAVKVSDFKPEIARKIKETLRHLSRDPESRHTEKQDRDDTSDIYATGAECDIARTRHIPKLKTFFKEIQG